MAQLNVDVSGIAPDAGFEVLPAGWYNVAIDESEMKPTKDGSGSYLNLRFNILDGQYHGRKLFHRLNLNNANAIAKEIAFKQLSAIGHAVGVLNIQDSSQLHGLPMKIRVKIRAGDGQYDDSNDVTTFKNINHVVAGAAAPAAPVPPVAAPAAAPAAGWGTPAPATAAPPASAASVVAAPPAPPVATPPAPPADEYQYTPDRTMRWKAPMTAWEPVPVAAPPAPQPPAPPATGWTPPTGQQPWATPAIAPAASPPAPPPVAPAPPAPGVAAAQGASPPWNQAK